MSMREPNDESSDFISKAIYLGADKATTDDPTTKSVESMESVKKEAEI